MYKILIVDDEKLVRKGIISKLQRNGFAFAWLGEASNGEEALEIIGREHPHIVITDIKMPYIDGIELIRRTKEQKQDIKFIIISGYAEFEYAEQALNMGVSGYILKPISDENLSNALKKVVASLDLESEVKDIRMKKEVLEERNDSLMFERMVNQIFHSADEPVREGLERYREFKDDNKYALVLIHIDSTNYYRSEFKYNDLELIKFSIKNILGEIGMNDNIIVLDNHKDITQIMVLVKASQEASLRTICDHFTVEAYSKIKKYLKIFVTMAVSGIEDGITAELFKQARAAFDLRLVHGGNQIYKYNSFEMKQKINFPEHKFKLLQNCLEFYDFKNINIILKDILSPENMKKAPGVYIRFVYSEIINMLLKICSQQDIDIEKSMDPDMLSGEIIDRFDNVDDIVKFLYTSIIDILKVEAAASFDCKDMVSRIKNYIAQSYAEDLMVKDLAHKFAVNPNYLSTIFKQETGATISKFIEDTRIDKACQLLLSTRNSISDIAQSVGYKDTQYFYRVFKKVTGVTPMEFRNKS